MLYLLGSTLRLVRFVGFRLAAFLVRLTGAFAAFFFLAGGVLEAMSEMIVLRPLHKL